MFLQFVTSAAIESVLLRIDQRRKNDFVGIGRFFNFAQPCIDDAQVAIDQNVEAAQLLQLW